MKPRYTFRRLLYMFATGWFLGGSLALFVAGRVADGIIYLAIGLCMLIYRLYHPNMLLKDKR